jgi:methylase of polypeptide subunit release factors
MVGLSAVDLILLEVARAVEKTGYNFTTITPESHRRVNARFGDQPARDLRDIFGWSRRFDPAILPEGLFPLLQAADAIVAEGELWRSRIRLSTLDDALFVHSAFPTQAPDAVFFGPDTYRFIAAVRQAIDSGNAARWRRAADIGCGSGAAGIVLARMNPGASVVLGDINPTALRFSRINAALATAPNAEIREADLLNGVAGEFDLIVANPPYLVDPQKRLYRHGGGARGEGLSLAIIDAALARLAPGGMLMLYTGAAIVSGVDPLREAAAARFAGSAHSWRYREIDPDVFGKELAHLDADRIAAVFLTLKKAK